MATAKGLLQDEVNDRTLCIGISGELSLGSAVVAEEAGLIGTVAILALFVAILWRGYRIARRVGDGYLKLCAMGFMLLIVAVSVSDFGRWMAEWSYWGARTILGVLQ